MCPLEGASRVLNVPHFDERLNAARRRSETDSAAAAKLLEAAGRFLPFLPRHMNCHSGRGTQRATQPPGGSELTERR
ncbi:hypothetical protein Q5P01_001153 [Channa striata]|uniref:Uncharacterized protein n=1 Tax=Channa striata TaxID=64152 RepID=A0AA88TC27_CHASR|nr:hypothetical protein Q5P01_001153 [Channa striata]